MTKSHLSLDNDNTDSRSVQISTGSWLDSLPACPKAYCNAEQENYPSTRQGKKRIRSQQPVSIQKEVIFPMKRGSKRIRRQKPVEVPSKHRKLVEMSANSMELSTQARRSKRLPANLQPKSSIQTRSTPKPRRNGSPFQGDIDPDLTPKPQRNLVSKSLAAIPHLPHLFGDPGGPDDSEDQSVPPSPSKSSGSQPNSYIAKSKSSRVRSPVKNIGDFELSDIQVEMKAFGTYTMPSGARGLCQDLKRIGTGQGAMPAAVKKKAMTYLKEDFLLETNFAPEADEYKKVGVRLEGSLDPDAFWGQILDILEAALECQNWRLPESSWNSEVHSKILRLALRGHWISKGVRYRDVTTAKITDTSLLPTVSSGPGSPMQSKMVDYVLVMERSPVLAEKIRAKLGAENRASINHTAAEHIRFDPIAVSIETKRAAIAEETAHVQLGMWVVAHFARLRQLTLNETQLPALPILIVQGHDWKFMIAEAMADRSIVILRDWLLGSTNSVLGIYQIVAAVRRLAKWVDEDYRPWFEKNAL